MNIRRKHIFLPACAATGSFLAMIILASLTSPIDNIGYAIAFFGLLAIFLVAVGHLLTHLRWGQVTPKSRYRIFIVSFLVLIGLMLRSSGSLNWIEGLVLILIGSGLWFYSGRRSV